MASAVTGTTKTGSLTMNVASGAYPRAMTLSNCAFTKAGAGTLKLTPNGVVLNQVVTTLAEGKLELRIGNADPKIENSTFIYVDENKDGVADGELTNHGWVHSTTTTTFVVPEGVTGKAVVGSCLSNIGAVVKQGAGTLVLGVMKTDNANPYTGTTTIEAGTLEYNATNNTANPLVMEGAISVAADAAIKGSANCTLASLAFANGAIIDATDVAVTATTVTLPEGEGKVKVRIGGHGEVLKAEGPELAKFDVEKPVSGCNLMVTEDALLYVATPVVEDVDVPEEVLDFIVEEAAKSGITSVTIEGVPLVTDSEGAIVKAASVEGLELFEGIPTTIVPGVNGEGKALLNYTFGISTITVDAAGYITVTAEVGCITDNPVAPIDAAGEGDGATTAPPTFINGVTVELYNDENLIGTRKVNVNDISSVIITATKNIDEIFDSAITGTLDLTVKVTNEPENP